MEFNEKYIISKEAIKELKRLQQIQDTEVAHELADKLICDVLRRLGFKDIVLEFNKINGTPKIKWKI